MDNVKCILSKGMCTYAKGVFAGRIRIRIEYVFYKAIRKLRTSTMLH